MAPELLAECSEGAEPDRASAIVLQHREVNDRDPDSLGELGQRETTAFQQFVEAADSSSRQDRAGTARGSGVGGCLVLGELAGRQLLVDRAVQRRDVIGDRAGDDERAAGAFDG